MSMQRNMGRAGLIAGFLVGALGCGPNPPVVDGPDAGYADAGQDGADAGSGADAGQGEKDAGTAQDAGPDLLEVAPEVLDLLPGETGQLTASGDGLANVTYTSLDEGVASVDTGGTVTAHLVGEARVRVDADTAAGPASADALVVVHPAPEVTDGCANADPTDIRAFADCPVGGGIFGDWFVDAHGQVAFDYTFDELNDVRGAWPNTENIERRDHFLMLGNDRFNFKVTDLGYVEVLSMDRGPTWLNRFDEDQRNLGGGFSYLRDQQGGEVFATAHGYAPPTATFQRHWGLTYAQTTMTHDGIETARTTWAPAGDDPVLLTAVTLTNTGDAARELAHFEYWDVNRHQLTIEWVRTGLAAAPSDDGRDGHNARFTQRVDHDADSATLVASMTPNPGEDVPPASQENGLDFYPPRVFLRSLDAPGTAPAVDRVYTDQNTFFGPAGPGAPLAVQVDAPGTGPLADSDAMGQPACLVMRTPVALAPGESVTLHFAYGYVPEGETLDFLDGYRPLPASKQPAATQAARAERLAYAWAPGRPLLHRETAWRSSQILANTLYHAYFDEHYTPQGSAYLYLHGADGAARDQLLYAMALTWLDPALARANLRLILGLTDSGTGQKGYAFVDYGLTDGAGLHEHPSDFDLFLFAGLGEYLAATGDFAFLDEEVAFHPHGSGRPDWVDGDTVLDHVQNAFYHLRDTVGLGPHGLIRIRDGDWSDGIVYEDLSPTAVSFTIQNGESVPNTQMALVTLPKIADLIEPFRPALATEMRVYVGMLTGPAAATFGTRWFSRAWLRNSINQAYEKGNDQPSDGFNANYLDLEAQPWGLLAGLLDDDQTETVLDEIEVRLGSSIGPTLREGGQVWPAISQLMTWAWARHRPAQAWQSLDAHLYATHADVFPEQWLGIWSGPDGFLADGTDGGTWASPVTPMTDFPIANMNPDVMWLLGLLRTAGVETVPDGLAIRPIGGGQDTYVIDYPLLRLEVAPGRIAGTYRPHTDGARTIHVQLPPGATPTSLTLDDDPQTVDSNDISVSLDFVAGEAHTFAVLYTP